MKNTTQEANRHLHTEGTSDLGAVVEIFSFEGSESPHHRPNALGMPLSEGSLYAAR